MMAPRVACVVMAVACACVVSACTGDQISDRATGISGSNGPASPTGRAATPDKPVDIPYAPGEEKTAKAFASLRKIDPCALLDPAAVERVTHDTADRILPDDDLGDCALDVAKSRYESTWRLSVEVGERYDPDTAAKGNEDTLETIEGVRFYHQKSVLADDDSCSYVRPVEGDYSVEFTVSARADTPAIKPCEVAKQYLTATASRWRQLPERTDKLTTPRLPLADRDPCEATSAVSAALGRAMQARPFSPYRCMLALDTGADPPVAVPGGQDVTITYRVDRDPATQTRSSAAPPQTIEGHRATQSELPGLGCTVDVVTHKDKDNGNGKGADKGNDKDADKGNDNDEDNNDGNGNGNDNGNDEDRVVIRDENDEWVQTVSVRTSTCDDAAAAATVVIKHIASR